MIFALLACVGDDPVEAEPLELTDGSNYLFEGGLDIASVQVQALTDVRFDWSTLDTDLQLHEMDPVDDVDMLTLLGFRYFGEAEVTEALSNNALLQSDIAGFFTVEVGAETEAGIADFTLLGNPVDLVNEFVIEQDKAASWLLVLQSGTDPGIGSRMLKFLSPSEESEVRSVEVTNSDTVLDFSVTVDGVTAVPGGEPFAVDWGGLTIDGLGNSFDHGAIDTIMVSSYPELSVAELEAQFLDLELVATELHTASTEGATRYDLNDLGDFDGIDETGTWVLALRCSTCTHPAPPYLTVLEVSE